MNELLAAVLGAFAGGAVTFIVQALYERRARVRQSRNNVHRRLIELLDAYQWFVAAEERRRPVQTAIRLRASRLSSEILDYLSECEDVEHMQEIVETLVSARFDTARQRLDALRSVARQLGAVYHPRFAEAMKLAASAPAGLMGDFNGPSTSPVSVGSGSDFEYPPTSCISEEGVVDLGKLIAWNAAHQNEQERPAGPGQPSNS